jgi:hypothetical protein
MSRFADSRHGVDPYGRSMSETHRGSTTKWLAFVVVGAAAALLLAWLDRVAGVPLRTLLSIGAVAVALVWLIALVSVPWNLYFAARRVVGQIAVSRGRGIVVPQEQEDEARRIARRMLWFALSGHLLTAAVTAVIGYFSGSVVGYYFTGFYLLSATIRPAVAYFWHLKERISSLSRESTHPRDDVATLREKVNGLAGRVKELGRQLPEAQRALTEDLRRTESKLAGDIGHTRQMLSADLVRLSEAQAADREAARTRDEALGRRIDEMIRRMEQTLDGVSDHEELQAGIRALVRMIRTDGSALS